MVGARPSPRWKCDLYTSASTLRKKVRRGASWQPGHAWDPRQRPCSRQAALPDMAAPVPLTLRGVSPAPEPIIRTPTPPRVPPWESLSTAAQYLDGAVVATDSVFQTELPMGGLVHCLTGVVQTEAKPRIAPASTEAEYACEDTAEPLLPLDDDLKEVEQRRARDARHLREARAKRGRLLCPLPDRVIGHQEIQFDEVDLTGGNGVWRRRRAEVELERRRLEEEEQRRVEKERLEERARRRVLMEERRKKFELEQQRRWVEKQERILMSQAEVESRRAEEVERERLRLEEEERLRLAKLPKPCPKCNGTKVCCRCKGHGTIYGLFLSPKVHATAKTFGKLDQGCEACDSDGKDIAGDLRVGTGLCLHCGGAGFIVPPSFVLIAQGFKL